jgi:Na+/proline symporter
MKTNFTALDFIVLAAYLIGTTLLGVWLGRNQKDSKDYFVAGHAIPWWAVLFSVVATETSALTFISIPGLAYTTNLGFLQIAAGYLLGRIVVAYTLLPRYYQGDLVTAYALLEKRFGVGTRRFASIVFLVTRAFAAACAQLSGRTCCRRASTFSVAFPPCICWARESAADGVRF